MTRLFVASSAFLTNRASSTRRPSTAWLAAAVVAVGVAAPTISGDTSLEPAVVGEPPSPPAEPPRRTNISVSAAIFEDPDRGVRSEAIGALEELPTDRAKRVIRKVIDRHPDAQVREEAGDLDLERNR